MTLEEIEKKITNGILRDVNNEWQSEYDLYEMVYGRRPCAEVISREEREEKWRTLNDAIIKLLKRGILFQFNNGYNCYCYKLKGL